jgi:hypothetical protein
MTIRRGRTIVCFFTYRQVQEGTMANRELQEWLGLTFADLLVYLGVAAIVGVYLVPNATAQIALAAVGLGLAIAACPLGMKVDPAVSRFTNLVKLLSYPLVVLIFIAAILFRYFLYAG